MNRAISIVSGKRYENVKVFFDVLYILIATVICLVFIGKLAGVREGSVIAALLVGNIIKVYLWVYRSALCAGCRCHNPSDWDTAP